MIKAICKAVIDEFWLPYFKELREHFWGGNYKKIHEYGKESK